jgi:peptidoglycan/LPS O-acetylase OafA/YrhL
MSRYTAAAERPGLRGEALATLGYVANWQALFDDAGYWDMFTSPSPLDHMWSLAIEEQFYLVWPLVVTGLFVLSRRRGHPERALRLLGTVSLAGAAVSFAVMWATYSPTDTNRAYYGTDTRIGPMLLGAALAAASTAQMRARRNAGAPADEGSGVDGGDRRPDGNRVASPLVATVAAAAGLAVIAWSFRFVDGQAAFYYQGGLLLFSAAAIVVIRAVTVGRAGPVGAVLRWRPLCALGTISYGVYLWHWPVIVYATPARIGVDGLALDAVRVAATLAVSIASFVLLERPIRQGTLLRPGWPVRGALVSATALALVAILVVTSGTAPQVAATTRPPSMPPGDSSANPYRYYPSEIPPGSTRILILGDSGPGFLAPRMALKAGRHDAVVAGDSQILCSAILPEGVFRNVNGTTVEREPCHDTRREEWRELTATFQPDVVVFYVANTPGLGEARLDGEWVKDCEPAYDDYMYESILADMEMVEQESGAKVVMTTSPAAVGTAFSADGSELLACRNATYGRVAENLDGAIILDLATQVTDAAGRGERMLRDAVHLSDRGADLMSDWMLPQLVALARGEAPPSATPAPTP